MKVFELVNTCNDIWNKKKLFNLNKQFKVHISFLNSDRKEIYEINDEEYLIEIRELIVVSWNMNNENDLFILVGYPKENKK